MKQKEGKKTNELKISIEVENGNENPKNEFLEHVGKKYDYVFLKENAGYGNRKYLQYALTPAEINSRGRKRKLSSEEESEIRRLHSECGFTISELVSLSGLSKATICRIFKR